MIGASPTGAGYRTSDLYSPQSGTDARREEGRAAAAAAANRRLGDPSGPGVIARPATTCPGAGTPSASVAGSASS